MRTMKTMNIKSDSKAMVSEFIAKGGQITKHKPKQPKAKRNEVVMVEIEVDALPMALRRLVGE